MESTATSLCREIAVPGNLAGKRLDQIAAQLLPEFSRARLQEWIASGDLLVDGQQRRSKDKLVGGEQLVLQATVTEHSEWQAEPGALNIVFEDDDLLVLNKPAGLVVHPGAGISGGTLANFILGYLPGNRELPRGGVVHRLDKDTTGLMVVAKSLQAHKSLAAQLEVHDVARRYRAIVCGKIIAGGCIDEPIGRHPTTRTRMAVRGATQSGAKHAVTHYRVREKLPLHTELDIELETGRTHQIRVHMAHIHHPLVGDPVYNPRMRAARGLKETTNKLLQGFGRQALHATELAFTHPVDNSPLSFDAEPPTDYHELIAALKADRQDP